MFKRKMNWWAIDTHTKSVFDIEHKQLPTLVDKNHNAACVSITNQSIEFWMIVFSLSIQDA